MIARTILFLLAVLPQTQGHGCDPFNLTTPEARAAVLAQSDDFVPASMKQTIMESNSTAFYGNYDCHIPEWSAYEVGVAYLCDPAKESCECTALYDFKECNSCTVCGDGKTIDEVNTFSADCSNIIGATDSCMVECGFIATGCKGEKGATTDGTSSGRTVGLVFAAATAGVVAMVVV